MLYALVMAGGTGTRFWPASRNDMPKQLLRLMGDATMLRQTLDRLGETVPNERRLVVTSERLVVAVREQLPELSASAVVGEPCKRDTAPCIGLAALLVSRSDPNATMVVMPSDHVIRPPQQFQLAVLQAVALVDESPGRIVTFGIKPTYPAEVFGYIHRGTWIQAPQDSGADHRSASVPAPRLVGNQDLASRGVPTPGHVSPAYTVRRFKEKPDARAAKQYLASGEYYWNSGIFVWRAATILTSLRERQPDMLKHLEAIVDAWDTSQRDDVFQREFAAITPISIDYAVMEDATDVAVIEAAFEWDDLGSWQSLARLADSDEDGNTIVGKHLGLDTSGSIVRTDDDHLIVTLGLKDIIVVHTPNATLVASKHDEEKIRRVVKQLEVRGWTEYL
jgi:mannose-1-phosphate guanylyltransferase